MKLFKRILKAILAIIILLLLVIVIILVLDVQKTSYLDIEKHDGVKTNSYLIKNVNVVPVSKDTILFNKMVHIKNGVIEKITDNLSINNIEIIDANNKYLTPGLIDMHVHVWDRYELGLYLSNGVTTVRNLWGMPMHLRIKQDIENDEILAPLFYTTGPKLTGPEFIGDDNLNLTNPEEAKEKIISYKERGYDFIKTYYGLTDDLFTVIAKQAKTSEMDIIAHPSQKIPYANHLIPQVKSLEHAEEIIQQPLNYTLDSLKLKSIVSDIAKTKHISFSPTLIVYYNIYNMLLDDDILNSEQLGNMNAMIRTTDSKTQFNRWYNTKLNDSSIVSSIKKQHDFHLYIVNQLHEAGVPIVCGTDAGIGITLPGNSIHQELAFYKEAGLSNYEVLKTATINASNTHRVFNNLGTIEEGKIANLLLLDNNPLESLDALKKPSQLFIKGKLLERETLDNFEEKAQNRKNFIASAVRYLENLIKER